MALSDNFKKENLKLFAEEYLEFLENKDFGSINKVQFEEFSLYLINKYKKINALNKDYELADCLGMNENLLHTKISNSTRYFNRDIKDSRYWNLLLEEFKTGKVIEIENRSRGKLKLEFYSPLAKWFFSQLCLRSKFQVDPGASNKQIIITVDALSNVMIQFEQRLETKQNELITLLGEQIVNDNVFSSELKEILKKKPSHVPFFTFLAEKLTKTSEKVLYSTAIQNSLKAVAFKLEDMDF
ncbi:hypothetical protein OAH04_00865 [Crocinitomicaceae bacterium]|nr:hypothetical protein [Crocinitomicaceae bacterium]